MGKIEKKQFKFGLVGKDISYSFSRGYFAKKFKLLKLDNYTYVNFDLADIDEFQNLLPNNPQIQGMNVTIPYKEVVIPYLDKLDTTAERIGAVNTIKITKNGLTGFNTDYYGFQKSIEPFIKKHHKKALILGTGGASKAIAYVFEELGIQYNFVSRNPDKNQFSYQELTEATFEDFTVLVNSTPIGTHPNVAEKPNIPYKYLNENHLLFDLIYNPEKTAFLLEGELRGAAICNGSRMLELQAEKAWEIWNNS